jgi:predicted TIM-barrel fold metal-dependent hydrolase
VLSRPKIDVHYHLGEWNLPMANTSASGAVADFDTFGFQYGLMSSSAALRGSAAAGNAVVAQALELDPRMKGYVYLDPYHPEQSAEDLERYAAHEGFVGIKTRPDYHGTTLEHPAYQPLLRRAVELKMPLLTHNCAVRRAVESVPGLQVVVAHSSAATARDYADLPNVCFCTASSSPFMQGEEVRKMIDTVGVDRILFGSDGPLISAAWNLGRFASSRFSVDEAEKIYAANALRVFQRLPKLHSRRSAACERGDR